MSDDEITDSYSEGYDEGYDQGRSEAFSESADALEDAAIEFEDGTGIEQYAAKILRQQASKLRKRA